MPKVWKPKTITVDVEMDNMGSLIVTPQKDSIRRKITKHLAEFGEESDGSVYIQEDYNIQDFLERYVPRTKQRELDSGYDVSVRIDPWEFGHLVGYDAHEVI